MKNSVNLLIFIVINLLVIAQLGCGIDTLFSSEESEEGGERATFVSAIPPSGSMLAANTPITVSFSGPPASLNATPGVTAVSENTATISGPFTLGALRLVLTWADGTHTLDYTVLPPAPEGMVFIPAGEFEMGSKDPQAEDDEQPVHTVSVDAFYMDAHEVTNREYHQFILENPEWQKEQIAARFHDGNYLKHWDGNDYPDWKAQHPVTWVSWYAAMAYSAWADKRLPTEAEWERAARGGIAGTKYPWRGGISEEAANYNNHLKDTTPVGRYPPNRYGLSDMCGNVWEWCLDAYDASFYSVSGHQNPFSSPHPMEYIIANFAEVQTDRVLRGGSGSSTAESVRVANRLKDVPSGTYSDSGFRCVKPVDP